MRRKSVAEEYPELVPQWGTINDLSPDKVSSGSHKKVWWVCEKGHTWEAVIKNRTHKGSGCPYCEHRAVLAGFNDLQTLFPDVAATWSPNNLLKPSEVSSMSSFEALWVCGNGHEWRSRVADRAKGHGCPYCAGQRVWKGFNDLATTHPWLVNEWSDKNGNLSPEEITYKNRSNVWWHCSKCGNEYQAVVYARANGRICPFCIALGIKRLRDIRIAKKRISKDFSYLLPQLAAIYFARQQGFEVISDSEEPVGIPLTAYIPEIGLAVDVCSSDNEIWVKKYLCTINNVCYYSIREGLTEIEALKQVYDAFSKAHIYLSSNITEDLERIRTLYYQNQLNKVPETNCSETFS